MDDAGVKAARAGKVPPLSHAEAARILAAVSEINAVLVGGQAVNFWARLLDDSELAMADTLLTSKDIDFEGRTDQAYVCARLLGGRVKTFRPPSVTSAEVYFQDSDGYPRVIDFFDQPRRRRRPRSDRHRRADHDRRDGRRDAGHGARAVPAEPR